jgi:PAS domain S-box-containing protein
MGRRVSEVATLQRALDSLRQEHEQLQRRAADAEQAVAAFARGEVDAVTLADSATPLLLHAAQDELRKSEHLLRAIFDGAGDAMLLADDGGRYLAANVAACELFQRPSAEIVGHTISELAIPAHETDAALVALRKSSHTGAHFPLERPDGSRRLLDYSAVPNVAPGLHLSVLRDVTDRIAADDAVRRSEALFRAVIEKSSEIISLPAADGTTRYLTPSAWKILGWDPNEVGSKTVREQVIPEDRERIASELDRLVRTGGRDLSMDLRVRHRDGSIRWFESTGTNLLDDPDVRAIVGNYRDITARKIADEAIRTSRDLLEKAQEMAHVGSWTSGIGEDDELQWTRECGRIFDVKEGTVITLGQIMTRVHPDDRERVMRARREAAEAHAPLDIEHRIVRDDGKLCWVRARTTAERRDGVPRMIATVQDITDRKSADAALRESEERYRRIVENTSEGIWVYNDEGLTTFMNARMAEMLGYTIEETLGQPVFAFMDESARAAAEARMARRRSGVGERSDFHFRRRDGTDLWASVKANPLFDAEGRFEAALALLTDVSLERRADEARAHLAAIVESAGDAIIGATPEGMITSWNKAAEGLYGWSASEAIGRPTTILILPENLATVAPVWERLRRGELIRHFETTHVRRDGSTVEVVFTASPIFDADHRVIGSARIVTDLTERRRAAATLEQTEAQLRQAQKMEAVGVLAGGVAHDFNNVLAVILSFASLVLDDLKPGDPVRADIQEIARAGERATELTRQLLAFSRKQVLQPQVLDLEQSVLGMEKMLRRLLGEAIELARLSHASLGRVLVDPGQFEQVVMNLAVNARDAMPRGGKLSIELVNTELDADYARLHHGVVPGRYVMLAVTDTGVGMDGPTRERIFEPFFTTKGVGRGTGLGLSTVFGIVKQSHGHIWVYSEPGQGTTFKVYFPRVEQEVEGVWLDTLEPETLRGSETVLLVEDEEQVRVTSRTILQRSGYNVLDALSGGDALLICEQFPAKIHLLLTDVVMPRMSGRQVAERLQPLRPEMKVLYVSGYTEDSIVHHGVLDAGIAFLQKPITPKALLRKVREVLDGKF